MSNEKDAIRSCDFKNQSDQSSFAALTVHERKPSKTTNIKEKSNFYSCFPNYKNANI